MAPSGPESISGRRVPRCEAQNGAPPSRHRTLGYRHRRFGGGLQNAVLAFPRHWYPTMTMLPALGGATQAPRERSARAPFDLVQGGGWLTPPTRSNASHQRTTLKPRARGESGWASCGYTFSNLQHLPRSSVFYCDARCPLFFPLDSLKSARRRDRMRAVRLGGILGRGRAEQSHGSILSHV